MRKNREISLITLRQSRGLSQRDLASSVGLSAGTIAQYELGNRKPSLKNALLIANYFDISVDKIKFSMEKS